MSSSESNHPTTSHVNNQYKGNGKRIYAKPSLRTLLHELTEGGDPGNNESAASFGSAPN
jgi:hypothetical protein